MQRTFQDHSKNIHTRMLICAACAALLAGCGETAGGRIANPGGQAADSGSGRTADSGSGQTADSGSGQAADSGSGQTADSGSELTADSGSGLTADSGSGQTDTGQDHSGTAQPNAGDSNEIEILSLGMDTDNIAGTGEGMYRIAGSTLSDGTDVKCLYYIDYASAQEIVLCNDLSCHHDTTDCMGIFTDEELSGSGITPKLFLCENFLYLFCQEDISGSTYIGFDDVEEGDSFEQGTAACLIQMKPDGTQRKRVYTFDGAVTLEGLVFRYGNLLCFAEKTLEKKELESGGTHFLGVHRKLVGLDTDTWRLEELCDFPSELHVHGACGDKLICSRTSYPEGYSEEDEDSLDFEEWREMFSKTQEELLTLCPGDGSTNRLLSNGNEKLNEFVVYEGSIYYTREGDAAVKIDPNTGETSAVPGNLNDYRFVDVYPYRERIECWPWDGSESYFWNPKDGSITRCGLTERSTDLAMEVLAENADCFVVTYDSDSTENQDGSYEINARRYGLIPKDDYYEGRDNTTPIHMVSDGLED